MIHQLQIFFSIHSSLRRSGMQRMAGGEWWQLLLPVAYPYRPYHQNLPIMTATGAISCQPTCCRHSATISGLIPTNGQISRGENFSTPTGPDEEEQHRLQPTMFSP